MNDPNYFSVKLTPIKAKILRGKVILKKVDDWSVQVTGGKVKILYGFSSGGYTTYNHNNCNNTRWHEDKNKQLQMFLSIKETWIRNDAYFTKNLHT